MLPSLVLAKKKVTWQSQCAWQPCLAENVELHFLDTDDRAGILVVEKNHSSERMIQTGW